MLSYDDIHFGLYGKGFCAACIFPCFTSSRRCDTHNISHKLVQPIWLLTRQQYKHDTLYINIPKHLQKPQRNFMYDVRYFHFFMTVLLTNICR